MTNIFIDLFIDNATFLITANLLNEARIVAWPNHGNINRPNDVIFLGKYDLL